MTHSLQRYAKIQYVIQQITLIDNNLIKEQESPHGAPICMITNISDIFITHSMKGLEK